MCNESVTAVVQVSICRAHVGWTLFQCQWSHKLHHKRDRVAVRSDMRVYHELGEYPLEPPELLKPPPFPAVKCAHTRPCGPSVRANLDIGV